MFIDDYGIQLKDRLATFFENLGWKVFTVPETATILLNGRVKFAELNQDQAFAFQTDILRTMLQIENVSCFEDFAIIS